MKLEFDAYSTICETKKFTINAVKADYRDFGAKQDTDPDKGRPHCCGNMAFLPAQPTQAVLNKYGITAREYGYICQLLRASMSFGACALCV